MVSKNHFPLKGTGFLGKMADSRSVIGNVQDGTRIFLITESEKASIVYDS